MTDNSDSRFSDLDLSEPVLKGLAVVGYESPSPIQAATIPIILKGADVVGQAQTGTGKTAAFALPILSRIQAKASDPHRLRAVPRASFLRSPRGGNHLRRRTANRGELPLVGQWWSYRTRLLPKLLKSRS